VGARPFFEEVLVKLWKRLFFILLAVTLIGSNAIPVQAADVAAKDTVQVQFQNKTGDQVSISLSGPGTYRLSLGAGKTKADIVPGKYSYTYQACGQSNKGTFNARKSGDTLVLPKCGGDKGSGGGGDVKVTIKNYTGGGITIYLSGPQSYTFNFPSGTSKMTVVPGKYSYTVYGCGTSMSGTKNFKGGGLTWMFWCG
jgi:hypothetical protein